MDSEGKMVGALKPYCYCIDSLNKAPFYIEECIFNK